ncbi:HAD family hydrolase [Candidatus Dojkabacteria bacterium]|uniref:HAD family hydrolase n=1 Tax=Candidatus Dojkabacteria bacterium TaxID=2099670 RepID=A0A955LBJ5_9BACT|nr:HAD family hydrolase [Candidatus Dojkabacteria bacterium]
MKQIFTSLGINTVLLDFDNTLIETHVIFQKCCRSLRADLAQKAKVSVDEIKKDFDVFMAEAYNQYFVNPEKVWKYVFTQLANLYPVLNDSINESLQRVFDEIYNVPIPLKEGALELLQTLNDITDLKIGLVTHAERDWTIRKLRDAGLIDLFPEENIFDVPVTGPKTTQHWQYALDQMNGIAENTLFIGDNLRADIVPALEIGALGVLLKEDTNWDFHHEGLMEESRQFITIGSLLEIESALSEFSEGGLPPIA